MSDDIQSTHSTGQDEKTILKRDTASPSSSFKRREFALATSGMQVVNEWDASVESEDAAKCQQITPCVAAPLRSASAPRKEVSGLQGKSSAVGPSIADIHDDQLGNPEGSSVCQSKGESDSDVQIRPKGPCSGVETEGNARPRKSRACSGIFSTNGIESHPISHAEHRLQLRKRSTGSFREALEMHDESGGGEKAIDCGISAQSIKADHHKGKNSRDSVDMCLLRQDSSFDFNPDADHYPIRRNSTGCTLVYPELSSEQDESRFTKLMSFFRQDSTVFEKICDKQIMVQHPSQTGRKPFGCRLHSCQSGDDQWFHFLKLDNTHKSLARQLDIRDDDEVLIINDDPVICIDHKQVLVKFLYSLKERKIQLVVRRMISNAGGGFEYIEMTAQIKADDTTIPKIERVDVSTLKKGVNFTKTETRYNRICFKSGTQSYQYLNVQNSSRLSVTSTKADSDVFVQDVYHLLVMWPLIQSEYLCTLRHGESNKYITVEGSSLKLTAQEGDPVKTKLDSDKRLFIRRDDFPGTYLKHKATTDSSYLACKDSVLYLHETEDPFNNKDSTYCQMIDVRE